MQVKRSFRKFIKQKLNKSAFGVRIAHFIRLMREKISLLFYNDYRFLKKTYKKKFKKELNFKNPETYTEKMNWLKLFYHTQEIEVCSDKYTVRKYLEQKGYGKYLNPLLGVYDSVNEIPFDKLPNRFVIKVSHGSSWNIICKDKSELNIKKAKVKLACWQKEDISVFGREWNYRSSPRKIIIEKFIDSQELNDYKFVCLNGKVEYIQINHDFDGKHNLDYYDKNWVRLPISLNGYNSSTVKCLKKPEKFNEMYQIAEDLSKNFPCVRIDFYNPNDKIYIGEITFFTGGALRPFEPMDNPYDKLFGDKLQLPEPNYNLDLYKRIQNG